MAKKTEESFTSRFSIFVQDNKEGNYFVINTDKYVIAHDDFNVPNRKKDSYYGCNMISSLKVNKEDELSMRQNQGFLTMMKILFDQKAFEFGLLKVKPEVHPKVKIGPDIFKE